jgi:hypothetical protein
VRRTETPKGPPSSSSSSSSSPAFVTTAFTYTHKDSVILWKMTAISASPAAIAVTTHLVLVLPCSSSLSEFSMDAYIYCICTIGCYKPVSNAQLWSRVVMHKCAVSASFWPCLGTSVLGLFLWQHRTASDITEVVQRRAS